MGPQLCRTNIYTVSSYFNILSRGDKNSQGDWKVRYTCTTFLLYLRIYMGLFTDQSSGNTIMEVTSYTLKYLFYFLDSVRGAIQEYFYECWKFIDLNLIFQLNMCCKYWRVWHNLLLLYIYPINIWLLLIYGDKASLWKSKCNNE